MNPHRKPIDRFPWFWLGMAGVFLFSVLLRFWGLGRFNTLVFDEVYFAKFASGYLRGIPLFEGHPPLSTYLIAIGIWIATHTPIGEGDLRNGLTGLVLSPVSYRWFNALTGSLIPMVVAAIAYQLSDRRSFALIAGLFAALDGLFLVESRYALINVYLVIFGLLGQLFLLMALKTQSYRRWLRLAIAGAFFGASVAVKWNGLGFLLGAYLTWSAAWVLQWINQFFPKAFSPKATYQTALEHLTQLKLWHILPNLVLIPFGIYYISWIPFIRLDPSTNFWQWQSTILDYHGRVGGMDAHPYCSPWYTWPLMVRPVAYFYKATQTASEPVPVLGPPLPEGAGTVIYDVHALGNPILWWFSTAALIFLLGVLVYQAWTWIIAPSLKRSSSSSSAPPPLPPFLRSHPSPAPYLIALYLLFNYAANWLPWAKVTRCVFIYHYMGASVFGLLAIAYLSNRWLWHPQAGFRAAGITVIFLIALAFVFWLPLYLGLPLSMEGLELRRWLDSWI
jgi:dolichyl-phosphate-mannose-protein mannosyltransferase